jgi:hypothetical protein
VLRLDGKDLPHWELDTLVQYNSNMLDLDAEERPRSHTPGDYASVVHSYYWKAAGAGDVSTCRWCGVPKHVDDASRAAYKRCGRCRRAKYCGEACQRLHWRAGHKRQCQPPAAQ